MNGLSLMFSLELFHKNNGYVDMFLDHFCLESVEKGVILFLTIKDGNGQLFFRLITILTNK